MNVSELVVLEGLSLGKTLAEIGAELSVGESAVSRTLSHMERLIGLQLVDRQGYRLRLTPTGRDLAVAASRAAQHLRDFDDLIDQYRRGEEGRLRVLSSNSPANYLLPQVINDFLQRFSKADIQLDVESGHDIWPVFAQGHYDIGIGPAEGPVNVARKFLAHNVWTYEQLYEDPIVLFVSAHNPLSKQRDVTLKSLGEHIFVGMYGETFWTRFLDQLATKGLRVGRVVELKGVEGVKRMVESGPGIGVHLRSAITREVREGRLATLSVPNLAAPYRYVLVQRANQGQLSLVSAFCELVRQRLPDMSTTTTRTVSAGSKSQAAT